MRRKLAQLSFEEKIRRVAELIRLSRKVKHEQLRGTKAMPAFISDRKHERERQ